MEKEKSRKKKKKKTKKAHTKNPPTTEDKQSTQPQGKNSNLITVKKNKQGTPVQPSQAWTALPQKFKFVHPGGVNNS